MKSLPQRLIAALEKAMHGHDAGAFLNPGASEEKLARLEREMGASLPPEFLDFYRQHDGQPESEGWFGIIGGERLLSVDEMLRWRDEFAEFLDNDFFNDDAKCETRNDPGIRDVYWSALWLPLTASDRVCDVLDLDPTPQGRRGQIFEFGMQGGENTLKANSFSEWLEMYITQLENGEYVYAPEYQNLVSAETLAADAEYERQRTTGTGIFSPEAIRKREEAQARMDELAQQAMALMPPVLRDLLQAQQDRLKEKRPLDQAEMERWQQELMNIVAAEDFFAEPEQQKAA
ncbi:MAG: SMI1/KNR4 family protein, partial [Methylobacillus sp.]|nr:SMI1/KNR4 family protein [Methylobacillus sp.]